MGGQRWRQVATGAGYLLGALLMIWGAASGDPAIFLLGLVLLAIMLLLTNG
jgi:hypothetical protein